MPTETVTTAVQTSLPDFELPRYQGVKPQGMKTALTGAGNRISRSHTIGDRVVLVIEAKVRRAGHEDTDDGLVYSEQLKVVDMFEVDDPAAGRLLSTVRQSYREADDERHGRAPLLEVDDLPPPDGWTDQNGVVATDTEVADVTGVLGDELQLSEPARALTDPSLAPVVVVFSDDVRCRWPDDFEKGAPRPAPGEVFDDGSNSAYVAQLIDAETGVQVGLWTETQESERLLALEQKLEAEELAEVTPTSGEGPVDGEVADPSPPDLDAPGAADFQFVDRDAAEIKAMLADLADRATAARLLKAEQAGRGRGLKPRKGVLEMLERHLAKLNGPATSYGDVAAAAVPSLPGEDEDVPF